MGMMNLKVLFIQREESYEEEYAPEALCCVDEWSDEDNPKWFENQCQEELKKCGEDVIAYKVIEIEVDQDKIREILLNTPNIKGKINE